MTGTKTRSTSGSKTRSTSGSKTRSARRAQLTPAQRKAAEAARAEKIAALHAGIGERVEQLTEDPAWRAMLDAARRYHAYSLNNVLSMMAQGAQRGMVPTRVAGFTTWKALGRTVTKGAKGFAVLAPCTYGRADTTATGHDATGHDATGAPVAGPTTRQHGDDAQSRRRVLRGFRVAYVFDVSQTEGEPLPEVAPKLLTGEAPAALWDFLTAQVTAHGYTVNRDHCGANGVTDRATRTVTVRPDVDPAQAVKTLAHELAHIECGHTAESYDYTGWAGLDAGTYTVPYVAGWSGGNLAVLRASASTVTAAAHRIIAALKGHDPTSEDLRSDDPTSDNTGA